MRISKLINIIDVDPHPDFFKHYPPMTEKTSQKEPTALHQLNCFPGIKSSSPETVRNIAYFGNEKTSNYPLKILPFLEIVPTQSSDRESTCNPPRKLQVRHVKSNIPRIKWTPAMREVLCSLQKKYSEDPKTSRRKWQIIKSEMNAIFLGITFTAEKCMSAYNNLHRKNKKNGLLVSF